ncbi:hypothetical protein CP061683_0874A, partial [Chlamydia psittaci 06-1683]
MRSRFSQF